MQDRGMLGLGSHTQSAIDTVSAGPAGPSLKTAVCGRAASWLKGAQLLICEASSACLALLLPLVLCAAMPNIDVTLTS